MKNEIARGLNSMVYHEEKTMVVSCLRRYNKHGKKSGKVESMPERTASCSAKSVGFAQNGKEHWKFSGVTERLAVAVQARGTGAEITERNVRRAAEAATDFAWLKKGDTVFVKPAANSGNPFPATTSPAAVRAMVGLLRDKGAGRVLFGDKPGVQSVYQDARRSKGASRKILEQNGLHRAAVESGAEIHYFDEDGHASYFPEQPEFGRHWRGDFYLPDILRETDHIVLLPRVSRHVLAGCTLGLKAAVGWLRDDSRLELHRDAASFLEKTAEINDAPFLKKRLRLVLSVATKVQTTFGPDMGYAAEPQPGLVFASESLLAHDIFALGWLLWCREFATPKKMLNWRHDPHLTFPGLINRLFVGQIWGLKEMLKSQHYPKKNLSKASDDRVLAHAAGLWGGAPGLELVEVNGELPESIKDYILAKASF